MKISKFRGQWYEGVEAVYFNFPKSREGQNQSQSPPLCSPALQYYQVLQNNLPVL